MCRLLGLLVLTLTVQIRPGGCFNVETKHYAVYREEARSMFGFSVAVYRDKSQRGWVLVGAPEAQTSQAGVYRGGAVYRCDIAADQSCGFVEFDANGHNVISNPKMISKFEQMDNKTLQWFGATLSTSKEDGGSVVACAPRYVWFGRKKNNNTNSDPNSKTAGERDPVGTCWLTNFTQSSTEFSPCRTKYGGHHKQGSCQAGFGAAITKDGKRLFVGAPGSWYWQGQLYSIDSRARFPYSPPEDPYLSDGEGQVFSHSLDNRQRTMSTKEGPAPEDDSYMGYSVTTGDFVGNGDNGAAVGIPRGSDLRGKVVLLTSQMLNHQNITGEQMGAYFGYSLATGDIDGDHLDDIIIGAPMYTIPGNSEMMIETGRIYVVYQGEGTDKFRKVHSRDGESDRGRFGLSIASLGDIDLDGYGDFAVGAPYAGPHSRGAVYIYHGSKEGVGEKYSQVIYAADLEVPLSTFGFSIAAGLDLDANDYPDMAVGAYESSTTLFFRSRPVIKMNSYVLFGSETKLVALDNRQCVLSDRTKVTCLPLKICFKYSGQRVQQKHDFEIQIVLDVKKIKKPRMYFLEFESRNVLNQSINVQKDLEFCRTLEVYIAPNIRDKLTPIDAEIRMSLSSEALPDSRPRDPRTQLRPVLARTTSRKDTIYIRKNCGADNVCIPDLHLTVRPNVDRYLLGSDRRLELEVLVENRREDGFEAMFNCQLPPGIDYVKIERLDNSNNIPVLCSAPSSFNNNTLKCDIGNPLPQGERVHFKVLLHPVTSHSMKPTYEFKMDVNTTNPETIHSMEDNTLHLSLPIWIETELLVEGESKPRELYYNPDNYTSVNVSTDVEFGPAITHNYTIRNQGPSEILMAEAYLVWPAQTLAGDELMYLVEQPETTGEIHCETANANYLSLKIEQRRRPHNYFLEPSGIYVEKSHEGKMINVHKGYGFAGSESRFEADRHEEERRAQFSSGHSHSRRVKINADDSRPGLVTTIYHHNGTDLFTTIPYPGITHPSVFITTESSAGYGGSTGFSGIRVHETSLDGSQTSSPWEPRTRYDDSRSTQRHYDSSTEVYVGSRKESTSRYDELRRQEEQRLMEQKIIEQQIEERNRADAERKMKDRERRIQLMAQREEEKRRRQEERERNRASQSSREYVYGNERHYTSEEEGDRRVHNYNYGLPRHMDDKISGDREETVGSSDLVVHLRNITSTHDYEKFNRILTADASNKSTFLTYINDNRLFVRFYARQAVNQEGHLLLEFQNGVRVLLEQSYGGSIPVADRNAIDRSKYQLLEGCPMFGPRDEVYIVLGNGQRFIMHSSYSVRSEERSYVYGSGHRDKSVSTSSWQDGNVETSYITKTREESRTSERKFETYGDENYHHESRFRRKSSPKDVAKFKKYDELHRSKRDMEVPRSLGPQGMAPDRLRDGFNDETSEYQVPPCEAARCVVLKCILGPLEKDEEVSIGARYRVNARTLKKVAFNEQVKVSTELIARVTRQPFIGTPVEPVVKSHEIYTNIQPTAPPAAPDVVPLWVVVLSACAGTIILLLLIYLLHKCGFFKRNRPMEGPERQPLNGGNY